MLNQTARGGLRRAFVQSVSVLAVGCHAEAADGDLPALGRAMFFDPALSAEGDQACASCHAPEAGWTGPDDAVNRGGAVYEGSIDGRFGSRKPPTVAYAGFAPPLAYDPVWGGFVGGLFRDGRATGWRGSEPLVEQAMGPITHPLEMGLPDADALLERVCAAPYAPRLRAAFGDDVCQDPNVAADGVARALAAYQASPVVSRFSSRYDEVRDGHGELRPIEYEGYSLFRGKAACATCHVLEYGDTGVPLFTNFAYANLGIPRNPDNPVYTVEGEAFTDEGLGGFLSSRLDQWPQAKENVGKHRVPTLRNVDARPSRDFVKAYGHNGYFESLAEVVHFYNTRDVLPRCAPGSRGEKVACWPAPEVAENLENRVGDLGLTAHEERAIVAFLGTLTDR